MTMKPVASKVAKKAPEETSLTRRASRSQTKVVKKAPEPKKSESPVKSLKSSKTTVDVKMTSKSKSKSKKMAPPA